VSFLTSGEQAFTVIDPTDTTVGRFCLANSPVSITDYCAFLNEVEPENGRGNEYVLFNSFHEYSPLERAGDAWTIKDNVDGDAPMTLVTLAGALEFAKRRRVRLITLPEWAVIRDGCNDQACSGRDLVKELGFDRLAVWALPSAATLGPERLATQSYPVVGWAKGRSMARSGRRGVYRRWARTGAVSVGIRCAWSSP